MSVWNKMEGTWRKWKGEAREQWGKLTDDHIDEIRGRRDVLIGTLQKLYGWSEEEAAAQVQTFRENLHDAHVGAKTPPTRIQPGA